MANNPANNMENQLPEGFGYTSGAELELRFNWLFRLRVLFGRPVRLRQDIAFRRDPGAWQIVNNALEVAPIGSGFTQE